MLKQNLDVIISKNPFVRLGDAVYHVLYDEIIGLAVEPGSILSETALAKELDISRTPIRNAMLRLEEDGLLERDHKQSFIVAQLKKTECQQLMEIRISIETQAAYWAVERITEKQLTQLKEFMNQFVCAFEAWNVIDMIKNDHAFHQTIINGANNQFITDFYKQITPRIVHYRNFLFKQAPKDILEPIMCSSVRMHKAIYNAINLGFAVEARERIERDIGGMSDMIGLWKE